MSVSGLCNVFINSEEKHRIFKESFPRIYPVSDNWVVYIRGQFGSDIVKFIKTLPHADTHCTFFYDLDTTSWVNSTSEMIKVVRYTMIYFFLEDHFLLKSLDHLRAVINDAITHNIDYFSYSFFGLGLGAVNAEPLQPTETKYFSIIKLHNSNLEELVRQFPDFYPFSLVSVVSKPYFQKLLSIEQDRVIRVPYKLQVALELLIKWRAPRNLISLFWLNKMLKPFHIRFVIYPNSSPFNLEKSLFNLDPNLLPLKIGLLKEELCANWDDDNGITGSSLIKRGLYPLTLKSETPTQTESATNTRLELLKGEIRTLCYYPKLSRIRNIPIHTIAVNKGYITVTAGTESYPLKTMDKISVHANITHTLTAHVNSQLSIRLVSKS